MAKQQVDVVEVVRHGEKLLVPEGMTLKRAVEVLQRQMEYEEQVVSITKKFDVFPWDGALAMYRVMEQRFGFVDAVAKQNFFGSDPPQTISVKCGPGANDTVDVPWGEFRIPGVEGKVAFGGGKNNSGQVVFQFQATVKRKYADLIESLAETTRDYLAEHSIYRGKALRPKLNGSTIEEIEFIDLSKVKPELLVFPDDVQQQIETNLFTPVLHTDLVRKAGIPLKRGVLLAGTFGTGKTLAAMVTARHATEHGWTFLYLDNANDLSDCINLAKFYEPCIIFAEDIDRVMEIDTEDNEILNILDGVLSKDSEIMTVLTTNYVDRISTAMFRPGRLDAVITITPPDSKTVQTLIKNYAGKHLDPNINLQAVGDELNGVIPAVVRECVERSKLYAITVNHESKLRQLTAEALLAAAKGMRMQLDLLARKKDDTKNPLDELISELARRVDSEISSSLNSLRQDIVDDLS